MLLARLGHDVVVVDQASFPSDTVSTHSIARSGVVQLHRRGLFDAVVDSGAPAIRQVTFHAHGESVSRPVKHKAGVGFVVAPRRYVLDTILATAAERAGACVRPGVADAKAVRRRTASRAEAFGELLERSAPQLAERLRRARRVSPVSGMLRMPNQVRQAFGPGWALVGDVGYHRDAGAGYGISDAFRDPEFLAVALDQALGSGAEEITALAPALSPERYSRLKMASSPTIWSSP